MMILFNIFIFAIIIIIIIIILIIFIITIIIILYTLPPEAVPPARPIMKGVFIATATPACAAVVRLVQELSPQRGVRTPGTGT